MTSNYEVFYRRNVTGLYNTKEMHLRVELYNIGIQLPWYFTYKTVMITEECQILLYWTLSKTFDSDSVLTNIYT